MTYTRKWFSYTDTCDGLKDIIYFYKNKNKSFFFFFFFLFFFSFLAFFFCVHVSFVVALFCCQSVRSDLQIWTILDIIFLLVGVISENKIGDLQNNTSTLYGELFSSVFPLFVLFDFCFVFCFVLFFVCWDFDDGLNLTFYWTPYRLQGHLSQY